MIVSDLDDELPDFEAPFDAIVYGDVLEHLVDPLRTLLGLNRWLAPGGHLLASVTHFREAAYTEEDFFGVRMYWSNWSLDDYRGMLQRLDFELLDAHVLGHGYGDSEGRRPEAHPLLFARKRQ